jgi:hypothetical protein
MDFLDENQQVGVFQPFFRQLLGFSFQAEHGVKITRCAPDEWDAEKGWPTDGGSKLDSFIIQEYP